MMSNRISSCMNAIEAQKPGTAIVVSHANAIICIINWWLRISEDYHLASIMYDTDPEHQPATSGFSRLSNGRLLK